MDGWIDQLLHTSSRARSLRGSYQSCQSAASPAASSRKQASKLGQSRAEQSRAEQSRAARGMWKGSERDRYLSQRTHQDARRTASSFLRINIAGAAHPRLAKCNSSHYQLFCQPAYWRSKPSLTGANKCLGTKGSTQIICRDTT
ncbi:hypothetical protein TWF225_002310 [Orbilia oligospora]|nr:hypothetical protein TWF225_002310 [Orbilia oligospora]KAF3239499.1 hypothetical protein TWF217_001295 [Orbilia oligospora]KAF3243964.1 hypothetical protein TWF128_009896 [Orbilia oligospora]